MQWRVVAPKARSTAVMPPARGATTTVSILYRERLNDNPEFRTSNVSDSTTGKYCGDGNDQSQYFQRQYSRLFTPDGKPDDLSPAAHGQWLYRFRCKGRFDNRIS